MEERSPSNTNTPSVTGDGEPAIDRERIRDVLAGHPVRLAVLFGSQVAGTPDALSDVDIAVELTPAASDDAADIVMDLLADLSLALERDDIDLSLVGDLRPRVGLAAFTEGEVLMGSSARAARHREAFERRVPDQTQAELRERFERVLEHVDETVGEGV